MESKWLWLALLATLPLAGLQWLFGVRATVDEAGIPLLAALFLNECGFVLNVVGAAMGVRLMKVVGLQKKLLIGVCLAAVFACGFLAQILAIYPAG